ncbi:hypothetical protein [Brevibacterium gallinarum]|uniref:Uncharacterized protein n=1 Tax=Brevibacterium gallinarum TaxID=2762220 RepID=A0ABR8WXF7_9MICO|nr:hypothetical protein [Brevibacterium gallinarum]MBD8021690.1 hypothetical protein [Brevibacterium gallinarum]
MHNCEPAEAERSTMLKELIIRFLLVAAPACAVLWMFAFTSGELRTPAGLTHHLTMTATLLGIMATLFGIIFLIAALTSRLTPRPVRVESQPLGVPATPAPATPAPATPASAPAPATSETVEPAETRLMAGAQQ